MCGIAVGDEYEGYGDGAREVYEEYGAEFGDV